MKTIMPVFMLDTNAINYIVYDELFLKEVIASVEWGKITLYITHIQLDELQKILDSNASTRSELLHFARTYCKRIPTMGVVCGVSAFGEACFSDGQDIEVISNGNIKMIYDALIATTAKIHADYLVTDDDKLRKRVTKELPIIRLLTIDEFHLLITDL